jgi:hypothetical protein
MRGFSFVMSVMSGFSLVMSGFSLVLGDFLLVSSLRKVSTSLLLISWTRRGLPLNSQSVTRGWRSRHVASFPIFKRATDRALQAKDQKCISDHQAGEKPGKGNGR